MGYWGDSKWAQSQWPVIIGNAKKIQVSPVTSGH